MCRRSMCSPIACRRFLALLSRVVCVEHTYKPSTMTEECGGRKVHGVWIQSDKSSWFSRAPECVHLPSSSASLT